LKKGQGCKWHSYREKLVEQLDVEEKVEETSREGKIEEVKKEGEAKGEAIQHTTQGTTRKLSLLDALIGEELFTSSATSSQHGVSSASRPTLSATKATSTLSQTQLDQNTFPSGLRGHHVAFERVPMVEFVKAVE